MPGPATLARDVPFLWQSLPPSLPVQCLGQWSSMPRLTSCARTEQIQLHFCCIRTSWLSCWKPLVSIASSVRTNWITRSMSCCGSKLTQMPVNLLNMKMFSRPPPRPNLVTHVLHSGFRRVKPWSLSPKRITYLTKVIRDDWNSLEWIRPSGYMEWLLFYWSGNGVRLRPFTSRTDQPAFSHLERGSHSRVLSFSNGVKRQLVLTALNARAREMVKFERLLRFSCTIRTHWNIFSVVAMWWSLFTATITGSWLEGFISSAVPAILQVCSAVMGDAWAWHRSRNGQYTAL